MEGLCSVLRRCFLHRRISRRPTAVAYEPAKSNKTPCPHCGHGLRLLADQKGAEVRCPKCNKSFVVGGRQPPPLPKVAPAASDNPFAPPETTISDDDAYEPEIPLGRGGLIPERMTETEYTRPRMQMDREHDVDWSTADDLEMEAKRGSPGLNEDVYLESARRRGILREDDDGPEPPRFTFFSGVFTYPWRGTNLVFWAGLSVGLGVAAYFDYLALEATGLLSDKLTATSGFALGPSVIAIIMTIIVLSVAAAACEAAIQDTANGQDMPQEDTLPPWDQWFFALLAWASLAAFAAAIGYPLSLAIGPIAFLITMYVLFPILLMSAMEAGSYFVPFSPLVLKSLFTYAHGWLTFYVMLAVVVGLPGLLLVSLFEESPPFALLLAGPVGATLLFIVARLFGRLAWGASGGRARYAERKAKKSARGPKRPGTGRKDIREDIRFPDPDEIEAPPRQDPPRFNSPLKP